jgi:SAM-dependent methyltransferase
MQANPAEFWDQRYSYESYAYGELPNEYLKAQLPLLPVGSILFPAEGEGRNAVHAATLGWEVSAFDLSVEGQKKALALAQRQEVGLDYRVGDLRDMSYPPEHFDAMALIYAHFPAALRADYHRQLDVYLKKGGTLIFEAFGKKQLAYQALNETAGGPKDPDMLFSLEEIRAEFPGYTFVEWYETEVDLQEGPFHHGKGWVVRLVAVKNGKAPTS